jgi:hypothetical protein
MRRRATLIACLAIVLLGGIALPEARAADPSAVEAVPVPTVLGPVDDSVGLKGEPWFDPPFVLEEAEPHPYVSEEFFLEGTARDLLGNASDAAYKTRILVVRPQQIEDFSGVAVVEWDNVTAQAALNPMFIWNHPYLLREGHAFVSVSAQAVGVCCSPVSHNLWDPVRYGDLHHPGDTYSFDIFAQAVEAVRANATATDTGSGVTGDLDVTDVIATGTSQSASRLHTHLDRIEGIRTANIDGYLLDAGGSRSFARAPVVPTIHFLSEDGLSATEPSAAGSSLMGTDDNYRLWEVPAASHADAEFSRYIEDGLYLTHIAEAPPLPWRTWDERRSSFRYGDDGVSLRSGCQPLGYGDNTYPRRYAARAALDQLIRWTTGDTTTTEAGQLPASDRAQQRSKSPRLAPAASAPFVPDQPPRVEYANGSPVRDANRQIVGGVRLPQIDVPVADYLATTCGLFGHTVGYDPITLATLYPSTDVYVAEMEAAIERALAAGTMLAPEAAELRVQLETAVVPAYRAPKPPGALDEGAAHLLQSLVG